MALRQLRQLQWRRTLYASSSRTSVFQLQSRISPEKLDLFSPHMVLSLCGFTHLKCGEQHSKITFSGCCVKKSSTSSMNPLPNSDLDDKLQMSLYEFLETRGITDQLATFLHEYMKNKGKTEYIRWMGNVKSYIEEKIDILPKIMYNDANCVSF